LAMVARAVSDGGEKGRQWVSTWHGVACHVIIVARGPLCHVVVVSRCSHAAARRIAIACCVMAHATHRIAVVCRDAAMWVPVTPLSCVMLWPRWWSVKKRIKTKRKKKTKEKNKNKNTLRTEWDQ
jgi:hypothetical protein